MRSPREREQREDDVDEDVLPHLCVLVVEVLREELYDLHRPGADHQLTHHVVELRLDLGLGLLRTWGKWNKIRI